MGTSYPSDHIYSELRKEITLKMICGNPLIQICFPLAFASTIRYQGQGVTCCRALAHKCTLG